MINKIQLKSKIYRYEFLPSNLLPSSLCDDHFSPHFVKLCPKFPVVKENFDSLHPLQQNINRAHYN